MIFSFPSGSFFIFFDLFSFFFSFDFCLGHHLFTFFYFFLIWKTFAEKQRYVHITVLTSAIQKYMTPIGIGT